MTTYTPATHHAWQDVAACRGQDPELFFHPDGEKGPARHERAVAAKAICARCPVVTECLTESLDLGETYGIRGGLAEDERLPLILARRNAARKAARESRPAAAAS